MAVLGGKEIALLKQENENLTAQLAALTLRCEDLTADKVDLRDQVGRLQDALVSKESPHAYMDQKAAEERADVVDTRTPAEIQKEKELAIMNRQLLTEIESDLFPDAESMQDQLSSQILKNHLAEIYPETAHGDGES